MNPASFFLGSHALAATADELKNLDPTQGAFPGGSDKSIVFAMMSYVLNLIPVILGALAFFAIIYSAVLYLTAMGDPTKTVAATKNITWIATGVVMIAVTLIVMKIVINIVGMAK